MVNAITYKNQFSPRASLWARAAVLTCASVNLALLATAAFNGSWILDSQSQIIPTDFVSFWSTSLQLQKGPAAHVYDWTLHRAVEAELLGKDYDGRFPWLNPPTFLLAVVPLAFLPYPAAFLSWVVATLAVYMASLRMIVPSRWAIVGACAFPASLWTVSAGQNGLLTGALIGSTLGLLERRPFLAGFCLGLLTYKPQFGILFPIVLMAGGKWRVIAAASVTAVFLAVASAAAFGVETWIEFLNSISLSQGAVLAEGRTGLFKIQSPYGAMLWLGADRTTAWTAQIIVTFAALVLVTWVWRRPASHEVKSASLGVGALLATPYAFIYDFPVLAVPIAFLMRAGLSRNFIPGEMILIAASSLVVFLFPFIKAPVGPLAACLVAIAVVQRARIEKRLDSFTPSFSPPAAHAAAS